MPFQPQKFQSGRTQFRAMLCPTQRLVDARTVPHNATMTRLDAYRKFENGTLVGKRKRNYSVIQWPLMSVSGG